MARLGDGCVDAGDAPDVPCDNKLLISTFVSVSVLSSLNFEPMWTNVIMKGHTITVETNVIIFSKIKNHCCGSTRTHELDIDGVHIHAKCTSRYFHDLPQ